MNALSNKVGMVCYTKQTNETMAKKKKKEPRVVPDGNIYTMLSVRCYGKEVL